jgi:hypothetical protein
MVLEPVYVKVVDGSRPLRVTARARSGRRQLVRISAAEVPSKMSKVWWFEERELRPAHDGAVALDIPAVGIPTFWLVLHVFSTAGHGWRRSAVQAPSSQAQSFLQVPEARLAFDDDAGHDATADSDAGGVVVSLDYG